MVTTRIAAGLAISCSAFFAALPAHSATLADALVGAYETSGLLEQQRAVLRAADEDVAQAVAALRPVLSWAASAGITDRPGVPAPDDRIASSLSLSASWVLYDFGEREFSIELQKAAVLATRQALVGVEQDVLLTAVEAYMGVIENLELVQLRRNNLEVITQELRAAEDRFEVGEVTRTDVSLAEAALAEARSFLAAAEGNLAQAVESYLVAIGAEPDNLVPASPVDLPYDEETATAFALRNHPAILQLQLQVAQADLAVKIAETQFLPRVQFGGSVAFNDGTDTPNEDYTSTESINLQVGGPIYTGGALPSVVRQAMNNRDAARSALLFAQRQITQQVGVAYAILRTAQAVSASSAEQIRASQVAFEGVREEATLGARTTLDVLEAEQDLLNARANAVSAQADVVIATYAVLSSMGLLTADYLNLGVQTYDPSAYYDLVEDAPPAYTEQARALERVLRAIGD